MKVPAPRPLRHIATLAVAIAAGTAMIGSAIANASEAAGLPDPCVLLTKVHAENTIAKGTTVSVKLGKLVKYGSGNLASSYCPEMVGKLTVSISLSHAAGGFGGVRITSTTHPTGLGPGDELIVGTGPTGGPVDFIVFHTSKAYVAISANGATPSSLTALARQVYPLVR
jgi:hypothetical protein